jgi:hypothetical protein
MEDAYQLDHPATTQARISPMISKASHSTGVL